MLQKYTDKLRMQVVRDELKLFRCRIFRLMVMGIVLTVLVYTLFMGEYDDCLD